MYRLFALFGIALLSIAAASTKSSPTKQLTPVGAWTIDYANLSCNLHRRMSSAGDPYELSLTTEPLDSPITLTIKHAEKVDRRDSGNATVHVEGAAQQSTAHFNFYKSPDRLAVREYLLNFRQHGLDKARDRLRFQTQKRGDFELQLPQFQSALKALATCKNDLHRSLGIDAATLKAIKVQPQGSIAEFIDSPPVGDDGYHINLLYWVRKDGKVEQCRRLAPTGSKSLDAKICPTLESKALFIPAKDAAGRVIRAPIYENVHIRTTIELL